MNGFSQFYMRKNYIPRGRSIKSHQIASLFLILSLMTTVNRVCKLDLYPFENVLQVLFDFLKVCLAFNVKQFAQRHSTNPWNCASFLLPFHQLNCFANKDFLSCNNSFTNFMLSNSIINHFLEQDLLKLPQIAGQSFRLCMQKYIYKKKNTIVYKTFNQKNKRDILNK